MTVTEIESVVTIASAVSGLLVTLIATFVGMVWKLSRTIGSLTAAVKHYAVTNEKLEDAFGREQAQNIDFRTFARETFTGHNIRIKRLEEDVTEIRKQ